MLGKKRYYEVDGDILAHLGNLIRQSFPNYEKLCEKRWGGRTLLDNQDWIVDYAYVEAAWRYSFYAGSERMPWGLHKWPIKPGDGFFET